MATVSGVLENESRLGTTALFILGSSDLRCSAQEVYSQVVAGGVHVHGETGDALVSAVLDVKYSFLKIAQQHERVLTLPPVRDYVDPVFHAFTKWSKERLRLISSRIVDLIEDGDNSDAASVRGLLEAIRCEGVDCPATAADFARRQARQQSGRRKAAIVEYIYNTTTALFDECARLDQVGDLLEWVLTDVRPEGLRKGFGASTPLWGSVSSKKAAANRQNAQKSSGPADTTVTRFNAVKHGLTASIATDYDAEVYGPMLGHFRFELRPGSEIEDVMVAADRVVRDSSSAGSSLVGAIHA